MVVSGTGSAGNAVAAGAIGFGLAGLAAPRILIRLYGLPDTGPFRFLARLWGTRTATLGAVLFMEAPGRRRTNVLVAAAAMNAVDTGVALTAGADVSARTKVMAAATSGAFALVTGALAARLL